jgi:hypothetical protein
MIHQSVLVEAAVFNRDVPDLTDAPNRGYKPLPHSTDLRLKCIRHDIVSYERRLRPEKRPVKSKKETLKKRITNIEVRYSIINIFEKD